MHSLKILLFIFLLPLLSALGEEQLRTITLSDGQTFVVATITKSRLGNDDFFTVLTIDNKKVGFGQRQIATDRLDPVSSFKLTDAQKSVLAREHSRLEADESKTKLIAALEKKALELKRIEGDNNATIRIEQGKLGALNTELKRANTFVDQYPIEMSKLDVAYDAAKAELSSGGRVGAGNNPQGTGPLRNTTGIKKEMESIAEKKVQLAKQLDATKLQVADLISKITVFEFKLKELIAKLDESKSASNKAILELMNAKVEHSK